MSEQARIAYAERRAAVALVHREAARGLILRMLPSHITALEVKLGLTRHVIFTDLMQLIADGRVKRVLRRPLNGGKEAFEYWRADAEVSVQPLRMRVGWKRKAEPRVSSSAGVNAGVAGPVYRRGYRWGMTL